MAQFEKAIREEINEKYSKAQDSVSDSKRPQKTMAIYVLDSYWGRQQCVIYCSQLRA